MFPTESRDTYYVPFQIIEEEIFDPDTGRKKIDPVTKKVLTRKKRVAATGKLVNHYNFTVKLGATRKSDPTKINTIENINFSNEGMVTILYISVVA